MYRLSGDAHNVKSMKVRMKIMILNGALMPLMQLTSILHTVQLGNRRKFHQIVDMHPLSHALSVIGS